MTTIPRTTPVFQKKNVVFGYLGSQLDAGVTEARWARWRPTVSLGLQTDFPIDRLELLVTSDRHSTVLEQVLADLAQVCPEMDVRVHQQSLANPWDFASVYAALHDLSHDYTFDLEHEDYFVHLTTGTHTAQICLFLLAESRHFPAQLLETSFGPTGDKARGKVEVIDLDLARYDQLAARFEREHADSATLLKGGIATRNAEFNRLISDLETVALRTTAPMLLTGPTGAGKTQMAKRVYALRAKRHLVTGRLVEVNCATLRGDNAMSALFGHKRGAFTGALADRAGLLREADGGLLFLDEIGEMGLDEQAMLLRALEEKRFLPMGSDKEVSSDFQLIAGTNKNLAAEVAAGRFRADLYARINLWEFCLPGLAARPEDIEPNLDYELERAGVVLGHHLSMNREAREQYLAFALPAPWPGNFRDLAASVQRMGTLAAGGRIAQSDVAREVGRLEHLWGGLPARTAPANRDASLTQQLLADRSLDLFEAAQLEAVLNVIRTTKTLAEAGRALFAVSRTKRVSTNDSDRLRKYLAKLGLDYTSLKTKITEMDARHA